MRDKNKAQYRVVLIHPDGSLEPGEVYRTEEALHAAMRRTSREGRKIGVRYHCEEWTVGMPTRDYPDPLVEKMTEYDL
jgi:hypothetical protein